VVTFLALAMAGYAAAYFVLREAIFPDQVAASFRARPWGIYPHAFFGIFAIAIGPLQFLSSLLRRRRSLHRRLGKVYLAAAVGTGISGFYMAVYSYGGWVTHLGFGGVSLSMLLTTLVAYREIRARRVKEHRAWMIRSYAVMFSAVTFRAWLGVLSAATGGDFPVAYGAASWLAWVLNLVWAEAYLRRSARRPATRRALAELSSQVFGAEGQGRRGAQRSESKL
jgi:uncharacterized membrane protein